MSVTDSILKRRELSDLLSRLDQPEISQHPLFSNSFRLEIYDLLWRSNPEFGKCNIFLISTGNKSTSYNNFPSGQASSVVLYFK